MYTGCPRICERTLVRDNSGAKNDFLRFSSAYLKNKICHQLTGKSTQCFCQKNWFSIQVKSFFLVGINLLVRDIELKKKQAAFLTCMAKTKTISIVKLNKARSKFVNEE